MQNNTSKAQIRHSRGERSMARISRRFSVAILGVSALVLIGLFGWHYCTAHTVEPSDLGKLKVGMDWAIAQKIVGTHHHPVAQPDGTYFVAIREDDRWCMVDLTLDSTFKITSIFHDH